MLQVATVLPNCSIISKYCIKDTKRLDICRNRLDYWYMINSESKRLRFDDLVSPNYLWRTFPRYLNVRDSSKERRKMCSQTFHTSPESKDIKNCFFYHFFF